MMARNITDLDKLRKSIEFMCKAGKEYRKQVKISLEKREARLLEPQEERKPFVSLKGDIEPS